MSEENKENLDDIFDNSHSLTCHYCKRVFHTCNSEDTCKLEAVPKVNKEIEKDLTPVLALCDSEICFLKWQLEAYTLAFKKAKGDLEKEKIINNTFRIICLSPDKMDRLVKNKTIDAIVTPKEFCRARRSGWETADIDTMQTFHELFSEATAQTYDILLKANSKINIKERQNKETADKIKNQQTQAQPKQKEPTVKLSKWEKMLASYKKTYPNAPETDLLAMMAAMGLTPETVK